MKTTFELIQEIASTRSRNEKEAILKSEQDNQELKKFFELALSSRIIFWQKKDFIHNGTGVLDSTYTLAEAFNFLEYSIATRNITGNAAVDAIENILSRLEYNDAKVIKLILSKKSGCDVGSTSINKVWSKLIPEFPCLLATNYTEKLGSKLDWKSGVIAQTKEDGLRVNLVIDHQGNVKAFTRAGNELNLHGRFDKLDGLGGYVIDGELLTINSSGKFNNRQVSNGICSKAVHGTMSVEESKMLHIVAWDCIPLADFYQEKSNKPYEYRLQVMDAICNESNSDIISLVDSRQIYSIEEAQEMYQEMLSEGKEGIILKDKNMLWENKRSKSQLKLKEELSCDLQVIGFEWGQGKFADTLGSLIVQSSDGKLVVNISGFTLQMRSQILANMIDEPVSYTMIVDDQEKTFTESPCSKYPTKGSIVEVEYNAKIKAKNSDTWSLFLPRFKTVRGDKILANTFNEIK